MTGAASGIGVATTRRIIGAFPGEAMPARRGRVAHDNALRRWAELDRGGHFPALEELDVLVGDIRELFQALR